MLRYLLKRVYIYLTNQPARGTIDPLESAKEPTTLQEAIAYFADPVNCRNYLVAQRWPDGVTCPKCGSKNVILLEKYNRWKCRAGHDSPQFAPENRHGDGRLPYRP